jgi:hypothetical protein
MLLSSSLERRRATSSPEVTAGRLRVIHTQPAIPPIQYFAVHRTGEISPLGAIIAGIARDRDGCGSGCQGHKRVTVGLN